jgi:hypothetical protein
MVPLSPFTSMFGAIEARAGSVLKDCLNLDAIEVSVPAWLSAAATAELSPGVIEAEFVAVLVVVEVE